MTRRDRLRAALAVARDRRRAFRLDALLTAEAYRAEFFRTLDRLRCIPGGTEAHDNLASDLEACREGWREELIYSRDAALYV